MQAPLPLDLLELMRLMQPHMSAAVKSESEMKSRRGNRATATTGPEVELRRTGGREAIPATQIQTTQCENQDPRYGATVLIRALLCNPFRRPQATP